MDTSQSAVQCLHSTSSEAAAPLASSPPRDSRTHDHSSCLMPPAHSPPRFARYFVLYKTTCPVEIFESPYCMAACFLLLSQQSAASETLFVWPVSLRSFRKWLKIRGFTSHVRSTLARTALAFPLCTRVFGCCGVWNAVVLPITLDLYAPIWSYIYSFRSIKYESTGGHHCTFCCAPCVLLVVHPPPHFYGEKRIAYFQSKALGFIK